MHSIACKPFFDCFGNLTVPQRKRLTLQCIALPHRQSHWMQMFLAMQCIHQSLKYKSGLKREVAVAVSKKLTETETENFKMNSLWTCEQMGYYSNRLLAKPHHTASTVLPCDCPLEVHCPWLTTWHPTAEGWEAILPPPDVSMGFVPGYTPGNIPRPETGLPCRASFVHLMKNDSPQPAHQTFTNQVPSTKWNVCLKGSVCLFLPSRIGSCQVFWTLQ